MKKYLLLRSNKQSGPYSADELRQMGLKPYDLIWVDGKSAAWRYPGEVDELKSFAPPVEEQPYDRFYKKPEEVKTQEAAPATSVSAPKPEEAADKQPQKKEKEYKRIFVTLPNGAAATRQPAPKPVVQQPKQVFGESLQPENTYRQPASEIPTPEPVKTRVRAEQPAPVTEPISYPQRRSNNRKPLVLAAACLAMAGMVALGIFIGMSLNKKEGVSLVKQTDKVDTPTQPAASNTAAADYANQHPEPLVGEVDKPLPEENASTSTAQLPPVVKKKVPAATDSANVVIPVKHDTENIAAKKEEPVKKPLPKPVAPNFEKLIAVSSNDYQVGPFGGISKLEFTLKNSSEYDLNLVVVQVEYLKVNKEVFKTENLYFRDVAANSTVTLQAPRSSRGNKVNYKVTLVNSKEHLYHAVN